MSKVTSLFAKEVPDSRENPTVEVLIFLDKFSGKAGVPSGASTGAHEAFSLPASQAINNINNEIAKNIIGKEFNQKSLFLYLFFFLLCHLPLPEQAAPKKVWNFTSISGNFPTTRIIKFPNQCL